MAHQGGRPARGSGKGSSARRNRAAPAQRFPAQKPARKTNQPKKPGEKVVFDAAPSVEEPRTFRLGAVPGATPGKWIDTWKRRMPDVPLELVAIDAASQRDALDELDAVLIRMPLDDETLHVISLYDEVPVVVAAADSHLMAVDELTAADLDGELLLIPADDVLGVHLPGTVEPDFEPLASTGDAIATVAAGVGIVIVPLSLARLHHRKDVDHRILTSGPASTVALAWRRDRTSPDVETFVGIVRGRTRNSSR
jgi:DNA-binding transcriptional LysR family regulator